MAYGKLGNGSKGKEDPVPGRRLVRHGRLHERPAKSRLLRQVGSPLMQSMGG
jgi:hypothetical protein